MWKPLRGVSSSLYEAWSCRPRLVPSCPACAAHSASGADEASYRLLQQLIRLANYQRICRADSTGAAVGSSVKPEHEGETSWPPRDTWAWVFHCRPFGEARRTCG